MHATRSIGPRTLSRSIVLIASLFVVRAHAQHSSAAPTPEAIAEARSQFERGVHFADQEHWADALEAFQRSRAIVERANTVFNMGSALVRLGRHIEAVQAFTDFLRIADEHDTARRTEAQHLLTESSAAIAHVTLTGLPANAEVLIDGTSVSGSGIARDVAVDPGRHVVELRAAGFTSQRITLTPPAGAHIEQLVQLVADAAQLARGHLRVSSNTAGASFAIDGRALPASGSVDQPVERGSHTVRVSAAGYRTFERTVAITEGETTSVQADLVRAEASGGVLTSPVLWIVVGAVVIGAGVGLAYYELAPQSVYGGSTGLVVQDFSRR